MSVCFRLLACPCTRFCVCTGLRTSTFQTLSSETCWLHVGIISTGVRLLVRQTSSGHQWACSWCVSTCIADTVRLWLRIQTETCKPLTQTALLNRCSQLASELCDASNACRCSNAICLKVAAQSLYLVQSATTADVQYDRSEANRTSLNSTLSISKMSRIASSCPLTYVSCTALQFHCGSKLGCCAQMCLC